MGESDHFYFFHAKVTTSNNDVNFVDTQSVHFASLKSSIRIERVNKVDRDFLPWQIVPFFLPPEIPRDIAFIPSILERVHRRADGYRE